jgi:hypothetical protein
LLYFFAPAPFIAIANIRKLAASAVVDFESTAQVSKVRCLSWPDRPGKRTENLYLRTETGFAANFRRLLDV